MLFGGCCDDLAILHRIRQCDEDGILGKLWVAEVVQRVGAAEEIGEEVFGGGTHIPLELRIGEGGEAAARSCVTKLRHGRIPLGCWVDQR